MVAEENEMATGCRLWEVQVHLEQLDGNWNAEKLQAFDIGIILSFE